MKTEDIKVETYIAIANWRDCAEAICEFLSLSQKFPWVDSEEFYETDGVRICGREKKNGVPICEITVDTDGVLWEINTPPYNSQMIFADVLAGRPVKEICEDIILAIEKALS
jgi:hypothetical protein